MFPSWFSTTLHKIVVEAMTSGLPQVCTYLDMANSVRWCGYELRREGVKGRKEAKENMEKADEGWFEKGRHTLPIKVESCPKSDYCWIEVNLATLTCWGYYQITNNGVSLSSQHYVHKNEFGI